MKILLLGYGVVGSGVYELIQQNKLRFKEEYEHDVEIVGILVSKLEKYNQLPHSHLFSNDFDRLSQYAYDVAIETIGGIEPAFTYVSQILSKGKPVITSNKDLIAEKGGVLHAIAAEKGVQLSYEASVGGGIPVLKPLRECLGGDQINEIMGIINGTTNFILTKMNQEGLSYEIALKQAQEQGFAEADPTSDVEGFDAVRKISILTKLGMKVDLDWKTIPVQGITHILASDVHYFNATDNVVKLMGISKVYPEGIYTVVRPIILEKHSKFASINNEFNAISVTGDAVGELFFSGKGAGKNPTATAVIGDLVDLLQNKKYKINRHLSKGKLITLYPDKANWTISVHSDLMTAALRDEILENPQFKLLGIKELTIESITTSKTLDFDHYFIQFHDLSEQQLIDHKNRLLLNTENHYIHL
jgi:Homoserine dehydrogenase